MTYKTNRQIKAKWIGLTMYPAKKREFRHYRHTVSLLTNEDIGSDEVKERYMKSVKLDFKVFEIERITLAKVIK